MDQIAIELGDDITLGTLRALAQGVGKRLVISFDGGARSSAANGRATRGRPRAGAAGPSGNGRRRRKLSPEARAALARNLVKARAARSAKAKAARRAKAKGAKEANA